MSLKVGTFIVLFVILLVHMVCLTSSYGALSTVSVFPGAQGFGVGTVAGRGGQIVKVTNLNDFGSGSFRNAVETSGPRIIVFEVGGEIHLNSTLWIKNPYITIAGQTAPPPGITLTGTGIRIPTHDVLIQHIYVRHTASDGTDAIDVRYSGSDVPYNIVIDHVSVAWGDDENMSFAPGGNNPLREHNVTFSNNLISEATGMNGRHNFGTLVSDGTNKFSAIGNLWMSHRERQPRVKGRVTANIVNNVSYNVGSGANIVVGSAVGPNYLNIIGNVFIPGPSTPPKSYGVDISSDIVPSSMIYLEDNVAAGYVYNDRTTSFLVNSPPVQLENISIIPSRLVVKQVLENVGARPAERDGLVGNPFGDSIDERYIGEVLARTGKLKTVAPSATLIMQSTKRSFYVPAYPNGDFDGDGYTNIEELLHQMSEDVEK